MNIITLKEIEDFCQKNKIVLFDLNNYVKIPRNIQDRIVSFRFIERKVKALNYNKEAQE